MITANQELLKIKNWLDLNKLPLNSEKNEVYQFSQKVKAYTKSTHQSNDRKYYYRKNLLNQIPVGATG